MNSITVVAFLVKADYTQNEKNPARDVCRFDVGCKRDQFDKELGKYVEVVSYFKVVTFNGKSRLVSKCKPGQVFFITGELISEKFINDKGEKKTSTYILAQDVRPINMR